MKDKLIGMLNADPEEGEEVTEAATTDSYAPESSQVADAVTE
ncbi:unnamed protein product [Nippostrongylus brasiliensis]|uniref:30S ribosomal protein S2 n=1 Tax=Nippostrongylus brasiliensis TaxID=27835 RepID=A0A0N4XR97_NIPBR|nr:unnamed protein product [Nippostrongylus brasiliensis]